MNVLCFVPVFIIPPEEPGDDPIRRPSYFFTGRFQRGPITTGQSYFMDYARLGGPYQLISLTYTVGMSEGDFTTYLLANAYDGAGNRDVYLIPANIDAPISDPPGSRAYFEAFNLPTDWLTPSNTYRHLLRALAGMIQFGQRYWGLSADYLGERADLFDSVTMDTRYRDFPTGVQDCFSATVQSFGYDSGLIKPNSDIRQMLRLAAQAWDQPFYLGPYQF